MVESMSRPSLLWLISEPGRALLEYGLSIPYNKISEKFSSQGDGHPVMVFPGYLSSEKSTLVLRQFLEKQGYDVYDWGLGRNVGKIEYLEILLEKIEEINIKTGKTISLIGWSLGGIFARQLSKERPDIVRQIITLGSPFSGLAEPNNISWVYRILNSGKKVSDINQEFLKNVPLQALVPTTAVFSKEDGVVSWKHCIEKDLGPFHQNIQVRGSHIGLGVNPSVFSIITDRLKLDKDNWEKYKSTGIITKKLIFPSN